MGVLMVLAEYFSIILPIFGFIVMLACLLLILYIKTRIDISLDSLKRLTRDAARIASALEEKLRNQ